VPYPIPLGGSTPLGAAAYAAAGSELAGQLGGQPVTHLVVAAGSLGTMAGLILGTWASELDYPAELAANDRTVAVEEAATRPGRDHGTHRAPGRESCPDPTIATSTEPDVLHEAPGASYAIAAHADSALGAYRRGIRHCAEADPA